MKPTGLDRLLRSAAHADQPDSEVPFGFEARVIARWRSRHDVGNDLADLSRFLRRAGVLAFAVLVIAGTAAWRQYREEAGFATVAANEYAIVDSAIQTEFSQ